MKPRILSQPPWGAPPTLPASPRTAMPRLRLLSLLALSLFVFDAHAGIFGKGKPPSEDPAIVVQARAVAATDRMEALAILEGYLSEGGDPTLLPAVTVEAGEQRRLSADANAARDHFKAVLANYPDSSAQDAAKLGLALLAYDQDTASGNTLATLSLVPEEAVPATMNADRYRILALAAAKEGKGEAEVRRLVSLSLGYAEDDPTTASRARTSLAHLMTEEQNAGAVDSSLAGGGDVQALARARAALAADDYARAIELAQSLKATFPSSELQDEADWVVRRAQAGDPYNPLVIGALLPLSGTYAAPGLQLKDAIELAARDAGGGVRVVFRDTAGDPDTAKAAFDDLVLKEGVSAIIGPLLKEEAQPIAERAQSAGVSLVTLTQTPGITDAGDWVYRGYLTSEQQIAALLDYSMGTLGHQSFGIMAPDSSYGQNARDEFTRQVTERGGTVGGVVMYPPDATDLRKPAAQLGGKDYAARSGEYARLKREAEEKGADPSKVVLPPAVEFDAIFVPDSYGRVPLVASALAYEEFAVGSFRPRRGVEPVVLLGLNGWNNPEVALRGGQYVRGSIFVDAFWSQDPDDAVHSFVQHFSDAYKRTPGVMEAAGYDAMRLMAVAARTSPTSREAFRSALSGAALGSSATRVTRFEADRELGRDLCVFSVDKENFVRVYPPTPETPIVP